MSRLLCRNKSIELLEPYEGKLSRTVLRGERGSNVPDLPDFIKERYKPELQKDDMSFLSRSFERHFNERPYLKHTCYLYLTKTTKERSRMQSNFSTLCRGHIIPKELDRETTTKFMEACEQFERIMNDSGLVRLRRLSTDEIVGTEGKAGLVERYFSLMPEGDITLQDIELSAREMRIGDNRLCLHTLSDAEDLYDTPVFQTDGVRFSSKEEQAMRA